MSKYTLRPAHLELGGVDLDLAVEEWRSSRRQLSAVGGNRLWLLSPAANAHPGLELYETFAYRDRRMDDAATIPVTINEQDWQQTLFLYRQR